MQIDPYILAFSAITVLATIWMGFWSAKKSKTASDFFVAGRSVSVGWNASAISGEYLSAASFMGVAGMVMSTGYDALWYPVCYACGYLFLLLFIAGPLRRFGAYTIPDFAEGRFDSPVFRKIAVVFVLFIGFFYTMPQMKGAGTTLAYIFPGLPYWAGVVLVGAVITLNVALGGMKGITLVQAFQYWLKMFAISVPVFVLMAVYGHYGRQLEINQSAPPEANRPSPRVAATSENAPTLESLFHESQLRLGTTSFSEVLGRTNWLSPELKLAGLQRGIGYQSKTLMVADLGFARIQLPDFVTQRIIDYRIHRQIHRFAQGLPSRQPLPEKAPKDEIWLNPFGPLTTKAAKAAVPHVLYDGQLEREDVDFGGTPWTARVKRVFNADDPSFAIAIGGTRTAWDLVKTYADYKLLAERFNFRDGISYLRNEKLKEIRLRCNIQRNVPSVIVPQIEKILSDGGVTVVRESGNVFKAFPTKDAIITPVDPKPLALLYTYSLIIALVCGTAGLPHILVRFYTNPDGVAAKRTTMWVMILIGVFYLFPPMFGVMGRNLFPDLYNGLAGVTGTDGVVLKLPRLLNDRWEPLGSVLSGITCAGAFAAFMSTFSGLLVSMTGALAHDVYGRILRPKSTPEQRLRAFKICAILCGGGAILLGFLVETFEINKMVGWAFAIAATSYFPLLFLSTWWRGITMKGAATGMLAGGTLSLLAIASTMFADQAAWAAGLKEFYAAYPLLRILAEQPAIWGLPLALALMVLLSKLTAKDIPSDIRMKMLVLHAPEKLGLKQEYIQKHQAH